MVEVRSFALEVATSPGAPVDPRGPGEWATVRWPAAIAASLGGAAATALSTGIPTAVIPNPWFTRMTPVQGYAYSLWALSALLAGVLMALQVGVRAQCRVASARRSVAILGGVGAYLAIGCPTCNKLVVLALGASGATSYFAPVQPAIGATSLGLLAGVVTAKIAALRSARLQFARSVAVRQDEP